MASFPLWLNLVLFVPAAALIGWAGARLERYADVLSRRTGMGQAFTGVLLLAGATSLPEVATTVSAIVVIGNPSLAVHNLLGGVALQTALLAVADAATGRRGDPTRALPGRDIQHFREQRLRRRAAVPGRRPLPRRKCARACRADGDLGRRNWIRDDLHLSVGTHGTPEPHHLAARP